MDALTGAPVPAQPQPAGSAPTSPLVPGQVVSARVVQALAADTFLLAVRGQTLVAQSPTPLPLDTVVQLAVRSGGTAGETVSVRLLPTGSAISSPESASTAWSARTIAAKLGLPDSDLSVQLVAACQRQGVPLRPATVGPLLRLLQEAQQPLSASVTDEASGASPVTTGVTASAPGLRSLPDGVRSSARALTSNSGVPSPAAESRATVITASNLQPTIDGDDQRPTPPVAAQTAGRLTPRAPDVPSRSTSAPAQPVSPPAAGMPLPGKPGSAIVFVPTFAAAALVTPNSPADPGASGRTETHGEPAEVQAQKSAFPVRSETVAARVAPELATPTRTQGTAQSGTPGVPVSVPSTSASRTTSVPAEVTVASAPLSAPLTERTLATTGDSKRLVPSPPRGWSPGTVRAVAALPVAIRPDVVARLAASPLPQTAALLPLAAIAVEGGLPRTAQFLPQLPASLVPAGAQVSPEPQAAPATGAVRSLVPHVMASRVTIPIAVPTPASSRVPLPAALAPAASPSMRLGTHEPASILITPLPALPFRESVDLAQGADPRSAIRQGFGLAGLIASTPASGESAEPPSLERLLTSLLSRLAASARTGVATAPVAGERSTVPAPGSEVVGAAPPRHQATPRAAEEAPGSPAALADESEPAPTVSTTANDLTAVREQVARDLLPPQDLTEYDRVLALPLAIAGQPVPARLAVTTRRSATGAQACWMRLDCELSRLGPVSVRLGGVEGAPVAITLVARPAAAAELAAALPQLTQDLHQLGVEAALRVVAEEEASA